MTQGSHPSPFRGLVGHTSLNLVFPKIMNSWLLPTQEKTHRLSTVDMRLNRVSIQPLQGTSVLWGMAFYGPPRATTEEEAGCQKITETNAYKWSVALSLSAGITWHYRSNAAILLPTYYWKETRCGLLHVLRSWRLLSNHSGQFMDSLCFSLFHRCVLSTVQLSIKRKYNTVFNETKKANL